MTCRPETRSNLVGVFWFRSPGLGGAKVHEGIEIHGGPEGVHPVPGQGRDAGGGGLPEGRDRPGDVLNGKKKYAGKMPSDMKRQRELEEENSRLKRILAGLSLHRKMLQDVTNRKH
jgi:putative transposase